MAPTLAEIILNHARCKQRVDEGFKAIEGVWEEVFGVFIAEVTRVIDIKLQDTLATLRKAGKRLQETISIDSNITLKKETSFLSSPGPAGERRDRKRERKTESAGKDTEETRSWRDRGRSRERKRRRLAPSHSPSLDSWQGSRQPRLKRQKSLEDTLGLMRLKIDQQAQILQLLTKENNEVRTWYWDLV